MDRRAHGVTLHARGGSAPTGDGKRCTCLRTMSELLFPHLRVRCGPQMKKANNFNTEKRVCRGSDPRHLRLTMDGLLDRHMWGATPCIKNRRVARLDLPSTKRARQIEGHFMGKLGRPPRKGWKTPR